MKILKLTWISFIFISIFIISCSDDITKTGGSDILIADPTITHTDKFGIVLGGDTTDWCSQSNTLFEFNPAFPNPTSDTVKLRFQDPGYDTISILYVKQNGDSVFVVRDLAINPGSYAYAFSGRASNLYFTIVRFIIRSKLYPSGGNYCRYFGDVQFY
jgi:hypothetical protein